MSDGIIPSHQEVHASSQGQLVSPPRLVLKPPHAPYQIPTPAVRTIRFLHPGYHDRNNILLILPAFDSGGIQYETAHTACAVLANCRCDGYLAATRDGARILDASGILTGLSYYFFVPGAQGEWWRSNSMYLYTTRPERSIDTNCPENAIVLRRDVHYLWDSHKFAILPKQGKWVVHVLDNLATEELYQCYHNLEMQRIIGVAPEFLLARFALAILSQKSIFLHQGVSRTLVVLTGGEIHRKVFSAQECRTFSSNGRTSRSCSPKKRSRSTANDTQYSQDQIDSWDGQDSSDDEVRGRARKRRCSRPQDVSFSSIGSPPSLDNSFSSKDEEEGGGTCLPVKTFKSQGAIGTTGLEQETKDGTR